MTLYWNLIFYNYTRVSYNGYIQAIIVAKNNSTIDHLCYDIIAYYALYLDDNKNKNEVPLQVHRTVYITTWLNTFVIMHFNEKRECWMRIAFTNKSFLHYHMRKGIFAKCAIARKSFIYKYWNRRCTLQYSLLSWNCVYLQYNKTHYM